MDSYSVSAGSQQHMQALARANQVRLARARLKRKVATGEVGAAEVILDCPWEAESMKISELLTSQRRWGKERCRKFLLHSGLSENKQIADMTERQRELLTALLEVKLKPGAPVPPPDRFRDKRLTAA